MSYIVVGCSGWSPTTQYSLAVYIVVSWTEWVVISRALEWAKLHGFIQSRV